MTYSVTTGKRTYNSVSGKKHFKKVVRKNWNDKTKVRSVNFYSKPKHSWVRKNKTGW